MGYYVSIEESQFILRKKHFDEAYKVLVALNDRDDLKTGGSWGGGGVNSDSPRPEGMTYHPAKWFSWMDANYPEKCPDLTSILDELGFHYLFNEEGDIVHLSYDDKTGAEEVFLNALAPFVEHESVIIWRGEDGHIWGNLFVDGLMKSAAIAPQDFKKLIRSAFGLEV